MAMVLMYVQLIAVVYNPLQGSFSIIHVYRRKICRGVVCLIALCDHFFLVSVFLPFCYLYILLHFKCYVNDRDVPQSF